MRFLTPSEMSGDSEKLCPWWNDGGNVQLKLLGVGCFRGDETMISQLCGKLKRMQREGILSANLNADWCINTGLGNVHSSVILVKPVLALAGCNWFTHSQRPDGNEMQDGGR